LHPHVGGTAGHTLLQLYQQEVVAAGCCWPCSNNSTATYCLKQAGLLVNTSASLEMDAFKVLAMHLP
jgi:hypothetical protein